MQIIKINFSKIKSDIFYQHIYPLYTKEFLFGQDLETFIFILEANFVLSDIQKEYIVEHWNSKTELTEKVNI